MVSIIYLGLVMTVGYIASRKKGQAAEEFFVAGRNLPWILLTPFLMAEMLTGGTTVGVAEIVHKEGITAITRYLAAPIGLTIVAFGFVKFYQRIRKVTIGETFRLLFDEKTRKAYVVTTLVFSTISQGNAALELGTALVPMFNISYNTAIWLSVAFLIVLAMVGLRGQAWMNTIHLAGIVIPFAIVTIAALASVGGVEKLVAALPPGHLNFMEAGPANVTAWITSSLLTRFISIIAITAIFAARSEKDGKIATVSTGFLQIAFILLPTTMGLIAYFLAPDMNSRHALWKTTEHLGEWATALISIGVLAAIVSTTPAVMMALGAIFARDVVLPLRPNLTDKGQIFCCRCAVVVIGVVGTALAIIATTQAGSILGYAWKATQARCIVVFPLLVSVLWRRIHPTVAFWTIASGVITGVIWIVLGSPFGLEVLWPAATVGIIVMVVGSLLAKPSPYKGVEGLALAENPDRPGSSG